LITDNFTGSPNKIPGMVLLSKIIGSNSTALQFVWTQSQAMAIIEKMAG
jgi:hypothetical protein